MKISATLEYGLLAVLDITKSTDNGERITAEEISGNHQIPLKFLESILAALRTKRVITSRRGPNGGYLLAVDPATYTVADLFRTLEGPLAAVRGLAPENVKYKGSARSLTDVWVATRAAIREVLENTTLEEIVEGDLPTQVAKQLQKRGSWKRRPVKID